MQSTLFNRSAARPTACRDRSGCLAHSTRLKRSVRPRTTCAAQQEDNPQQANVCPTCGIDNASRPRGCDGEGRIAGGLGAVVKWFPIKAYRPCPAAAKGNFSYTRRGQITDEVLFGKPKQKQ